MFWYIQSKFRFNWDVTATQSPFREWSWLLLAEPCSVTRALLGCTPAPPELDVVQDTHSVWPLPVLELHAAAGGLGT